MLLNILCWIVVPKFVWSTFAHQRCLTSVIYAHKKWFSFSDVIQLKLPFCCRDRRDIANMPRLAHRIKVQGQVAVSASNHNSILQALYKNYRYQEDQCVCTWRACRKQEALEYHSNFGFCDTYKHSFCRYDKVPVSVYLRWILCVQRCWVTEFPVRPFQRNVDPWEKLKFSNQYYSVFFSNFNRCSQSHKPITSWLFICQ